MAELIWDGKYNQAGKKSSPIRIALPFQTVETVNETAQQRQTALNFSAPIRDPEWRNRLIWGDKKYVLASLLPEYAGKVNLIYIDPPFFVDADFSYKVEVGEVSFTKLPSVIEQKAYRDTWGRGMDSYLCWFYETLVLLHELLADAGSIYVHLDWHIGHYAKLVLDEVFGQDCFLNEIIWWYYNKFQGNVNRFASNHDVIFWYVKGAGGTFAAQSEERDEPVKQLVRVWDKEKKKIVNAKGPDGRVLYQESTHRTVDDVWRISMLQPADKTENVGYETQKPEALVKRIIEASSNEGDLVLDCFCGSGTTAAVAERLNRRWIACDLGRFAIHTTRKRLLEIENVRPFVVQNLGKYERQAWQLAEFGERAVPTIAAYRKFILDLYHAEPVTGFVWLHGKKGGRMVHIGSVDSPVTPSDVQQLAIEFRKAIGTGKDAPKVAGVDVLGWEFALDMNETVRQIAQEASLDVRFIRIPREVLESKAVEQGDVQFFELAALRVDVKLKAWQVTITLTDFMVPPDDVPDDVLKAVKHWSEWIDYWAVDFNYWDDTFHNEWQSYRTRKDRKLELSHTHEYAQSGTYTILVKVIDILGNDTTKALRVEVR